MRQSHIKVRSESERFNEGTVKHNATHLLFYVIHYVKMTNSNIHFSVSVPLKCIYKQSTMIIHFYEF